MHVHMCISCKDSLILIINFYGAYIVRNLSSEAQQNRIIKHIHELGRAKSLSEQGTTEDLWWKCNLKCLELFSEDSFSFRCFQSDGELIPDLWCSDRESPQLIYSTPQQIKRGS